MKLISYRNNKHKLSIQIFNDKNNSDLSLIFLLIFLFFLLEKKNIIDIIFLMDKIIFFDF